LGLARRAGFSPISSSLGGSSHSARRTIQRDRELYRAFDRSGRRPRRGVRRAPGTRFCLRRRHRTIGQRDAGREIWIRFATWILLALEFALAADLVRTAVAPTWDDISKLAVIATIRTMLNYFLAKDIAEFEQVRQSGGNQPSDKPAP
jgi:uncharacterized membrane protein